MKTTSNLFENNSTDVEGDIYHGKG